jgi:hypothetical protein
MRQNQDHWIIAPKVGELAERCMIEHLLGQKLISRERETARAMLLIPRHALWKQKPM